MTQRIVVLTGPVRSGKTTRLTAWVRARAAAGESVAGILAPTGGDERSLCSIATGECRVLTAGPGVPEDRLVAIGPHRFDGAVFAWARGVIAEADSGGTSTGGAPAGSAGLRTAWVVVDEVGPLELGGSGLEPAVRAALDARGYSAQAEAGASTASRPGARASARLLLVVREGLVERVLEHYGLPASAVGVVRPDELTALA